MNPTTMVHVRVVEHIKEQAAEALAAMGSNATLSRKKVAVLAVKQSTIRA